MTCLFLLVDQFSLTQVNVVVTFVFRQVLLRLAVVRYTQDSKMPCRDMIIMDIKRTHF